MLQVCDRNGEKKKHALWTFWESSRTNRADEYTQNDPHNPLSGAHVSAQFFPAVR